MTAGLNGRLASGDAEFFRRLREHLSGSRSSGLSFEEAWRRAEVDGLLPPRQRRVEGVLLVSQRELVESTRGAWARAYDRQPPGRMEAAVSRLADVLGDEADPDFGRREVLT